MKKIAILLTLMVLNVSAQAYDGCKSNMPYDLSVKQIGPTGSLYEQYNDWVFALMSGQPECVYPELFEF